MPSGFSTQQVLQGARYLPLAVSGGDKQMKTVAHVLGIISETPRHAGVSRVTGSKRPAFHLCFPANQRPAPRGGVPARRINSQFNSENTKLDGLLSTRPKNSMLPSGSNHAKSPAVSALGVRLHREQSSAVGLDDSSNPARQSHQYKNSPGTPPGTGCACLSKNRLSIARGRPMVMLWHRYYPPRLTISLSRWTIQITKRRAPFTTEERCAAMVPQQDLKSRASSHRSSRSRRRCVHA